MMELKKMCKKEYKKFIKKSMKKYEKELFKSGFYKKKDALKSAKKTYTLEKGFKNTKFSFYTLYNDKDKKVGRLWLAKEKRLLFISEIYIRKKYRHQGYGKDLMLEIEKIAKKLKVNRIGLSVFEHNAIAKSLYTQSGFSTIAETRMKRI